MKISANNLENWMGKIFVWKGDLEQAILSSKNLHNDIGKCLGINFEKPNDDQKAQKKEGET